MNRVRTWNPKSQWAVFAALAVAGAAGCNTSAPSDQQVQQQAAQTTAVVKQEAKQAVAATQVAAADAEREVNDVAAGVKQGIHQDAPKMDLNTTPLLRLATLPGISFSKAGDIVKARPYTSTQQLVSRGILTGQQYAQVAPEVTVGK